MENLIKIISEKIIISSLKKEKNSSLPQAENNKYVLSMEDENYRTFRYQDFIEDSL